MDLRDRRGAITPAEGCMFGAVALFVILLLVMLYIAFLRFGGRPQTAPTPDPVGMLSRPTDSAVTARPAAPSPVAGIDHLLPSAADA